MYNISWKGGFFMGLFGGCGNNDSSWIWIVIIVVFVLCFCNDGNSYGNGNNNCCENNCHNNDPCC